MSNIESAPQGKTVFRLPTRRRSAFLGLVTVFVGAMKCGHRWTQGVLRLNHHRHKQPARSSFSLTLPPSPLPLVFPYDQRSRRGLPTRLTSRHHAGLPGNSPTLHLRVRHDCILGGLMTLTLLPKGRKYTFAVSTIRFQTVLLLMGICVALFSHV